MCFQASNWGFCRSVVLSRCFVPAARRHIAVLVSVVFCTSYYALCIVHWELLRLLLFAAVNALCIFQGSFWKYLVSRPPARTIWAGPKSEFLKIERAIHLQYYKFRVQLASAFNHVGTIAQWLELPTVNREAMGSSPATDAVFSSFSCSNTQKGFQILNSLADIAEQKHL